MASEEYPSKAMDVTIAMWQERNDQLKAAEAEVKRLTTVKDCLRIDYEEEYQRAERTEAELKQVMRALPYDWRKQYERAESYKVKYYRERKRRVELTQKLLELCTKITDFVKKED